MQVLELGDATVVSPSTQYSPTEISVAWIAREDAHDTLRRSSLVLDSEEFTPVETITTFETRVTSCALAQVRDADTPGLIAHVLTESTESQHALEFQRIDQEGREICPPFVIPAPPGDVLFYLVSASNEINAPVAAITDHYIFSHAVNEVTSQWKTVAHSPDGFPNACLFELPDQVCFRKYGPAKFQIQWIDENAGFRVAPIPFEPVEEVEGEESGAVDLEEELVEE
jgi:hypothetical protein